MSNKTKGQKIKLTLPIEEVMSPGHLACQGCGATLALRYTLKALGRKTIMSIPACCWSVIDGPFPYSAAGVPIYHCAFETAASTASGISHALAQLGQDNVTALAWAGDGGTFDIGLQALSGAAERGDNVIYIVYDNEAYMNTGIQRSSATPHGAWTTTTPVKHYKRGPKKNIMAIMAAHHVPYCATANIAYPEDFIRKVKKAKNIMGTKFIHLYAPCPTGWKHPPDITIQVARLATLTNVFPLYEIDNDVYTINKKIQKAKPVSEYLKLQGRFRHLSEKEVQFIQRTVDQNWKRLLKLEEAFRNEKN
ncbi:3-methyl-2-oxobutanoate dehydrogenase subunit beta [bacterium]|nr:3-methyl-2-oxobutanoate dehydrogenase subunit beta [bacterium]RQV98673.1 MAG: 3-methyl-2-oxobutanoate dehydrogenase subunit beta [bacterium]